MTGREHDQGDTQIVTRELMQQYNGKSWVAYRANAPEVQSFGDDATGAKYQFLVDEKARHDHKQVDSGHVPTSKMESPHQVAEQQPPPPKSS